jgi:hypothetical protein
VVSERLPKSRQPAVSPAAAFSCFGYQKLLAFFVVIIHLEFLLTQTHQPEQGRCNPEEFSLMSFHPAFPSTADLSREAAAITRDLADLATLRELHSIVAQALDRASRCDTIRYPDRRWTTEDLTEALQGTLSDIDDEAQRIRRGSVVLEDE